MYIATNELLNVKMITMHKQLSDPAICFLWSHIISTHHQ